MHAPPGARCALVQLLQLAFVATPHAVDTYSCVHISGGVSHATENV